jgi:hypothetical protein
MSSFNFYFTISKIILPRFKTLGALRTSTSFCLPFGPKLESKVERNYSVDGLYILNSDQGTQPSTFRRFHSHASPQGMSPQKARQKENKFTDRIKQKFLMLFLGEFIYNYRSCLPHLGIREMRKRCKNIFHIY